MSRSSTPRATPAGAMLALVVIAGVVGAVSLTQRTATWSQSQLGALGWVTRGVVLLAPVVAAWAAVEAAVTARSALATWAAVAGRPLAPTLRAAARAALPVVLLQLVLSLVALGIARADGLTGSPPLASALPAVAAIVACAALGAAIGVRLRPAVAAPAAAAASFALVALVADVLPSDALDPVVIEDAVGWQLVSGWVVASVLTWLALGAAAVLLLARRGAARLTAIGAVAAAGVVTLALAGPASSVVPASDPVTCVGTRPAVCSFPERAPRLPATRRELLRLQGSMEALGTALPPWPARYAEVPAYGPGATSREQAQLTVADPSDRPRLVEDVAAAPLRCREDSYEPAVPAWLATSTYGPGSAVARAIGDGIPPPRMRADRLRRDARSLVAASRRSWCP